MDSYTGEEASEIKKSINRGIILFTLLINLSNRDEIVAMIEAKRGEGGGVGGIKTG